MTEEIIIDGVNVAGCEFLFENNNLKTKDCECINHIYERMNSSVTVHSECKDNHDCYYKQLKRSEQERDELQDKIHDLELEISANRDYMDYWDKKNNELKKQNTILLAQLVINDGEDVTVQISQSQVDEYNELKQENKELKETIQELNKSIQDCNIQRTKIYKALEEIRDYLYTLTTVDNDFPNTETYLRINDKIEEVLNEN